MLNVDLMSLPVLANGERPRKKPRTVRRSTRSCIECKRRKVRCQLSTEIGLKVCSGCAQRGIICVTQESIKSEPTNKIDERLGRVETLLEKLVEKEKAASSEADDHPFPSPPEDGRELLPQISSSANAHETGPLISLLDTSAVTRRERDHPKYEGEGNELPPVRFPTNTASSRLGKTRQVLSALLPCQKDADLITASSNGWVVPRVVCMISTNPPDENLDLLSSFNLSAVAEREPTIIARTLLYIAICLQQLPPEFDFSKLQMCERMSQMDVAETYVSTVASLITTDDTLSTTIPGLECLLLQSLFHKFAGHLQRAWMTIRRALTVAQLLNLHSDYLKPLTEEDSTTRRANKILWVKAVAEDRYLGMLMGLPPGTGDDCFGDQSDDELHYPNEDHEFILVRKLCIISAALNKRNKTQDTKDYTSTQRIDERLKIFHDSLPQSWWELPASLDIGGSVTTLQEFDTVTLQMWFFQLRSLLHLPFLVREDLHNTYEYSRISCVNASRGFIIRYLALRRVKRTAIMCKTLDFGAFIACVIMILGQLRSRSMGKEWEPQETSISQTQDEDLIQEIISSMELIARSKREVVVRESVMVLKTLLETNTPSSKRLRLTIPYIGTISVLRDHLNESTPALPPLVVPRACSISSIIEQKSHPSPLDQGLTPLNSAGPSWQSTNGYSPSPFLSFDPSFEEDQIIQGWEPEPQEEIFFYSMMGSDVGGEWIF